MVIFLSVNLFTEIKLEILEGAYVFFFFFFLFVLFF